MRRWAALVGLLAVAGCGDADRPTTSARVVVDAATETTAGPMRFSQTVSGSFYGRSLGSGTLEGAVDSIRRRGSIKYDVSFLAKVSAAADPGLLKGAAIFHAEQLYFQLAGLQAAFDPRKRWVKVARAEFDALGGRVGIGGVGTLDPVRPIDHLRAARGVEQLGTATIAGTKTTRYRTEVDFRDYPPLAAPSLRAELEASVDEIGSVFGTTTFPFEVYIAADGTIRRVKSELSGRGTRLSYTLDVSAIGEPVRIRPPAARTVVAYADL